MSLTWTYGVTTVPSRRHTTLPKTLESLHKAGFHHPRLFVDGEQDQCPWSYPGYEFTPRWPAVHAFGNFWLGLLELYLRYPLADLFGMFQDDILLCRNTRQYVEESIPQVLGRINKPLYFNLFTCKPNEDLVKMNGVKWHFSNQLGWGGQALVLPRDTMQKMFMSRHLVERPLGMRNGVPDPKRAWRNLDGGVIASVKSVGGAEMVHYPSLVYHIECESVIGNSRDGRMVQGTWPGEAHDAMTWVGKCAEMELVGK